jgi:hypothetical protein
MWTAMDEQIRTAPIITIIIPDRNCFLRCSLRYSISPPGLAYNDCQRSVLSTLAPEATKAPIPNMTAPSKNNKSLIITSLDLYVGSKTNAMKTSRVSRHNETTTIFFHPKLRFGIGYS